MYLLTSLHKIALGPDESVSAESVCVQCDCVKLLELIGELVEGIAYEIKELIVIFVLLVIVIAQKVGASCEVAVVDAPEEKILELLGSLSEFEVLDEFLKSVTLGRVVKELGKQMWGHLLYVGIVTYIINSSNQFLSVFTMNINVIF